MNKSAKTGLALALALGTIGLVAALAVAQADKPDFTSSETTGGQSLSDRQLRPGHNRRHAYLGWHQLEQTLTVDQQQQLKLIRQKSKTNISELRQQMHTLWQQVDASPQSSEAKQWRAQLKSLKQQLSEAVQDRRKSMLAVLTPEQRAKWDSMQADRNQPKAGHNR